MSKEAMPSVYEYEEILEKLAEELEPNLHLVREFLFKLKDTPKPLSLFSTFSFFPKIESIRIGLFELIKVEEHYTSKILFRALIEHFIKFQYLLMKTLEQKGDEIGIDFWVFGRDQEKIDYAKALHQSYLLIGVTPSNSPSDVLRELGIISDEKSAQAIRKRSEQFRYKNMVHYIGETLKFKDSQEAPLFQKVFPRYSELSSFVHGGPDSVWHGGDKPEAAQEILDMSVFMSLCARNFTDVLMYQFDKGVEPLLNLSMKYVQEHVKT